MAAQGWVWSQLKIVIFGVVNTEGGWEARDNSLGSKDALIINNIIFLPSPTEWVSIYNKKNINPLWSKREIHEHKSI